MNRSGNHSEVLQDLIKAAGTKAAAQFTPLYHGTHNKFEVFRTRRSPTEGYGWSMGAYFTDDPEAAKKFGEVKPYSLELDKPLDLRGKTYAQLPEILPWLDRESKFQCSQTQAGMYSLLEHLDRRAKLVPKLKKRGYDGIIFDHPQEGTTYVAFRSDQIKELK